MDRLAGKERNQRAKKETTYNSDEERREDSIVHFTEGELKDTIPESGKSIVLILLKQLRPGMDLSRVVLPTFILEPRSMLEKLSDFLTHCELLCLVPKIQDPLQRILGMVKWYLSGFYIKPKGVKKPYNPILGETFRCMWKLPQDQSKTFFVSEQVSHHPPVSAFYASNRKAGFIGGGCIHFRTTFTGLSAGSILDGFFTINLLPFQEEYKITFPSAYGSGFLFGTLLMELAGAVSVSCAKTGYRAEIEFKQKPMFGGEYNGLSAKILLGDRVLYTLQGKWDSKIELHNTQTNRTEIFWNPTPEVRKNALLKRKPKESEMGPFESEKLWAHVTEAIQKGDQQKATDEKAILEEAQREATKDRQRTGKEWVPKLFEKHGNTWKYMYYNNSPWNPQVEIEESEMDGMIFSKKRDGGSFAV